MPVYEYNCRDCRESFEKLVRIVGAQQIVCPHCGSSNTLKKLSIFATKSAGVISQSASSSGCAPGGT